MKNSSDNRSLFFKKHDLDKKIIISAGLVHKNKVSIVENIDKSQVIPDCDALITNQAKCLLTLTVADCLPVYFYDRNKKVVAIAHAGWRGIVSGIVKEVIGVFSNYYGSSMNEIEVFVGPHIRDCHFEVKEDVAKQFQISEKITKEGKIFVNLSQAIKNQLIQLDVDDHNIYLSQECTYCLSDKYFSYRRGQSKELETMMAYIGLKEIVPLIKKELN